MSKRKAITVATTEPTPTTPTARARTLPAATWKNRFESALRRTAEDNPKLVKEVQAILTWTKSLPDDYGATSKAPTISDGDTVVVGGDYRKTLDALGVKDGKGKVDSSERGYCYVIFTGKMGTPLRLMVHKSDCEVIERAPAPSA